MEECVWYKDKFYAEQKPDDYVLVEFHAPIKINPDVWACDVQITKEDSYVFNIRAFSVFAVIFSAFERVRHVIVEKYPDYLHNGEERVEHLIPRPIEWYYGDEIRIKTEKYMDELIAEKDAELTRNRIQWLRSHPEWVAENSELVSDEDWAAIRSDNEKQ
jgi:hypothetical protein